MKKLLPLLSLMGLALVIVPPCLYVAGILDKPEIKTWMLAGTIVWFTTVPLWMGKKTGDKT